MKAEKITFIGTESVNVFVNQGVEAALTESVGDNEIILYVWSNDNTVVIGRNQNAYAECRVEALESGGGLLARRLSGGGAVYHDGGGLNYTFIAANENLDKERNFAVVERALRSFGIETERSGRNDLLCGGAKVGGCAYYRRGGASLHHGTLIVSTPPERIAEYLTPPSEKFSGKMVKSVSARVAPLADKAAGITVGAVAAALKAAFASEYPDAVFTEETPMRTGPERLLSWVAYFASDEWRYGRKEEYNLRMPVALFGAEAQLRAVVDGDKIVSAVIDSDGMEAEKICAVRERLTGADLKGSVSAAASAGGERGGLSDEDGAAADAAAADILARAAEVWYEKV